MNALSLFSGIGGIDLACDWAGIKTVAMCEREPFCQKVLHKHWPDVPIYDDVCTLTKERLEADGIGTIDLIQGGYPCQPFSLAGNREGTEDVRHLWPEVFRLIQEIEPRWFVGENVAGHVTLGLDIVLSDLESIGYSWQPFVIPACAVDAPHRRDRIFIVAYSDSVRSESERRYRTNGEWEKEVKERFESQLGIANDIEATPDTNGKPGTLSLLDRDGEQSKKRNQGEEVGSENRIFFEMGADFNRGVSKWEAELDQPRLVGMDDGIPNVVERGRALGNAVVPQQIYPILAAIKQIDDMMRG